MLKLFLSTVMSADIRIQFLFKLNVLQNKFFITILYTVLRPDFLLALNHLQHPQINTVLARFFVSAHLPS